MKLEITEKELLQFATEEELFLFAGEEDYLAIANGVMELVNIKLRQQLASQPSGEPWHGHEFKELKHGLWKCKCGKELHTNPNVDVLVEAAKAVVERWETPLWKDVPHTGDYIYRLRDALNAYPNPITVKED
jgi:hypothetical protein